MVKGPGITITLWRPYSEYPGTDFRGPFERCAQAMASTVFAVGAMLSKGRLTYAENDTGRDDADILRVAEIATIEPDDVGLSRIHISEPTRPY